MYSAISVFDAALPAIYLILTTRMRASERGRAFGWLIAGASAGYTLASLVTPLLLWSHSFYLWGSIGLLWAILWYNP